MTHVARRAVVVLLKLNRGHDKRPEDGDQVFAGVGEVLRRWPAAQPGTPRFAAPDEDREAAHGVSGPSAGRAEHGRAGGWAAVGKDDLPVQGDALHQTQPIRQRAQQRLCIDCIAATGALAWRAALDLSRDTNKS